MFGLTVTVVGMNKIMDLRGQVACSCGGSGSKTCSVIDCFGWDCCMIGVSHVSVWVFVLEWRRHSTCKNGERF